MSDTEILNNENFDGGNSIQSSPNSILGGNSQFSISPSGDTDSFDIEYQNIARSIPQIEVIEATFKRFNDPNRIRFINGAFDVVFQDKILDKLSVIDFFHPLQEFSNYQKQTFVISPKTSANLDPSTFTSTNGEVSLIIAKAEYLPGTSEEDKILFWDYKANQRNVMGEIMILSGAIKNNSSWMGWDVDPFSMYDHNEIADSAMGGFIFTNPTSSEVKLTVITAN